MPTARAATSRKLRLRSEPATLAKPFSSSMSPSATSIMAAANCRILCAASLEARWTEEPALTAVRAANEPTPSPVAAVSPVTIVTSSGVQPNWSAAIWASVVLCDWPCGVAPVRSEEHTSELQSRLHLVCRLLLEKKKGQLTAGLANEGHQSAAVSRGPMRDT